MAVSPWFPRKGKPSATAGRKASGLEHHQVAGLPKGSDDRAIRTHAHVFPKAFGATSRLSRRGPTYERNKERAMLHLYVRLSEALEGFRVDASGDATVEYTLIASIISIAVLVSVALFGQDY